tara:strand:+ start:363 stop:1034 length:672 start_codon:yes stop_codon:yes gene_type:complete
MNMNKYMINFAQEGKTIILASMFMSILSFALFYLIGHNTIFNIFLFLTFFFLTSCFFFRDPDRSKFNNNDIDFLSPADGTVLYIKDISDPDLGEAKKIAIFLSFFNVHRQWVPCNSKVVNTHYNPGKYFIASKDKASLNNEQTSILFIDSNLNKFRIKQIAGFVARRIINHMKADLDVKKGQNLGFIKFGSRVEIIVPHDFTINIKKGDKVRGCKTIVGSFKS